MFIHTVPVHLSLPYADRTSFRRWMWLKPPGTIVHVSAIAWSFSDSDRFWMVWHIVVWSSKFAKFSCFLSLVLPSSSHWPPLFGISIQDFTRAKPQRSMAGAVRWRRTDPTQGPEKGQGPDGQTHRRWCIRQFAKLVFISPILLGFIYCRICRHLYSLYS